MEKDASSRTAAESSVASKPRSWIDRLGDYLDSRPSAERRWKNNLVVTLLVLVISLWAVGKSGIIGSYDLSIQPDELDLSGTWKIKFDDSPVYARADLDDSNWCLISVPLGGDPSVGAKPTDHPSSDCPKESYPRERMRNATYWYRKTVVIPPGKSWKDPTLFIGAIKQEGWVYWDGQFMGAGRLEAVPLLFLLPNGVVSPGRHQLAVRVLSQGDMYPGIYHPIPKKVALGPYQGFAPVMPWARQILYIEPMAVIFFQFTALFTLTFLIVRSRLADEAAFWLALYFGASSAYASSAPTFGEIKWYLEKSGNIGMSIALVGYGLHIFSAGPFEKSYLKRVLILFGLSCLSIETVAFRRHDQMWLAAGTLDRTIVYGSVVFLLISFGYWVVERIRLGRGRTRIKRSDALTVAALFFLHGMNAFGQFLDSRTANFVPTAALTCILTFLVLLVSIEEHVNQQRRLAFFGRFLRRGLQDLLDENEKKAIAGAKIFKGRKIPIMKIDIVDHTKSTFGLPYGLKREFQDLWFTHVDQVVAEHIFLDKGQGDGSYYFFQDDIPGGSCRFAIQAAQRIIQHTVAEFDAAFQKRMEEKLKEAPELHGPMRIFLEQYSRKSGKDFMERSTHVRIALVYGFVDEGLWGLNSQGHYDVAGDLLSLAARLEPQSRAGKIAVNEAFLKQWEMESASDINGWQVEWIESDLKGIGTHRFAIIAKNQLDLQQKAG